MEILKSNHGLERSQDTRESSQGWPGRWLLKPLLVGVLALSAAGVEAAELTFIHMGDVHGHLVPRPSARGETKAATEGGLARIYTKIEDIRKQRDPARTLLINTGDT